MFSATASTVCLFTAFGFKMVCNLKGAMAATNV